jgi:hypothetical protein
MFLHIYAVRAVYAAFSPRGQMVFAAKASRETVDTPFTSMHTEGKVPNITCASSAPNLR